MDQSLQKPIFIIGAARSGTSLLGEVLSRQPDLAYILEPKYIWRYGMADATDDLRLAEDWNKKGDSYIKKKFSSFVKKNKKRRLLEKTPSNCFRIPFIYKLFPDARFIHLIRDGRKVILSAEKKWTSVPERTALKRRLISNEIPIGEIHKYIYAFIRDVIARRVNPEKGYIWGPQFPGIQEYRKQHTTIECCAEQWKQSIEWATQHLKSVPYDQQHTVRYENLVSDPELVIDQLCAFLSFERGSLINAAKTIVRKPGREETEEEKLKLEGILPIIQSTLKDLNYV